MLEKFCWAATPEIKGDYYVEWLLKPTIRLAPFCNVLKSPLYLVKFRCLIIRIEQNQVGGELRSYIQVVVEVK